MNIKQYIKHNELIIENQIFWEKFIMSNTKVIGLAESTLCQIPTVSLGILHVKISIS